MIKMDSVSSSSDFANNRQQPQPQQEVEFLSQGQLIQVAQGPRCLQPIFAKIADRAGRKKLREFEFYPNWMGTNEIVFQPGELEALYCHVRNMLSECQLLDVKGDHLVLQGVSPIIWLNTLGFLRILQEEYIQGDEHLITSNRIIDLYITTFNDARPIEPYVDREYVTGLFYIVKGLKLIVEAFRPRPPGRKEFDYETFLMTAVEEFPTLSRKAKAAVWASKLFFLELIRYRRGSLRFKDIHEIVFFDPESFEWRLNQYLSLRRSRKACVTHNHCPAPDDKEIQAVQYAYNIAPYNPYCIAYMCLCVADCMGTRGHLERMEPFLVGQRQFKTFEEAASFVKTNCNLVKRNFFGCVRLLLLVADILGELLPYKYRDVRGCQEAIYQAFRVGSSTSSNANHRLVTHILQHLRGQMVIAEATSAGTFEPVLQKALAMDPRNEPALFDLLLLYMSHPVEREQDILSLFDQNLIGFIDITKELPAKLMFLKGCFHMMMGKTEDAIDCWITVHNNRKKALHFSLFRTCSYVYRVFGVDHSKLSLPLMISETNKAISTSVSPSESKPDHRSYFKRKRILMEILQAQISAHNSDVANFPTVETEQQMQMQNYGRGQYGPGAGPSFFFNSGSFSSSNVNGSGSAFVPGSGFGNNGNPNPHQLHYSEPASQIQMP